MEETHLYMLDPVNNHNKTYDMYPNGDGTFDVVYGRVGASGTRITYNGGDAKFQELVEQKLRKGYKDVTSTRCMSQPSGLSTGAEEKKIDPDSAEWLLNVLWTAANRSIRRRNVNKNDVTQAMVDEAQRQLNALALLVKNGNPSVDEFNDGFMEVLYAVPQQAREVKSLFASNQKDFQKILLREQSLLRNLGAMATKPAKGKAKDDKSKPDLTSTDISIIKCDDDKTEEIKRHMDKESAKRVVSIWSVRSKKQDKKFETYSSKRTISSRKYFWHGSLLRNWWNIHRTSLLINSLCANGRMFGDGIYFADKIAKSLAYTDVGWRGKSRGSDELGIVGSFEVEMGSTLEVTTHTRDCHNYPRTLPNKYDSVFAKAGTSLQNNEIIVYNTDACALRYLTIFK